MFYIGCKQIEAWPEEKNGQLGYGVKYQDGYTSWSPKEVFESAYLPMGHKPEYLPEDQLELNSDTITHVMVENFITDVECQTWGEKTTIVKATLANGFILTESSSCVDPANYSEDLGKKICLERITNQVWHLLGFLLQSAKNGFSLTK